MKLGVKLVKPGKNTVVYRRNFRHSWITHLSKVILEPIPFNIKSATNDDWLHDQFKVAQPVVNDRNRS